MFSSFSRENNNRRVNYLGITIKKGSRIAIAVGSRDISRIHEIVIVVAQWVKDKGGYLFIIIIIII
ncbi:MAG: hypothetical protein WAO75_00475 [Atribacterales bacterium]